MRIVLIHKAKFATRPPVISSLCILNNLGVDVMLISEEINEYWKSYLTDRGVEYKEVKPHSFRGVFKLIDYFLFKKKVFKIIKSDIVYHRDKKYALWVEGAYTIFALGKALNNYEHILQIQELHEHQKYFLWAINNVIHSAKAVLMPEYNRTFLYQIKFKLFERPLVLPNKPYFFPSDQDFADLMNTHSDLIELFKNNKVILYQGHISEERDLASYARAFRELKSNYKFVLLGQDHGKLSGYLSINPDIVHINYLPAPTYLLFTKLCYCGIVTYSPMELNTAFCAPNKIYEYACYGKPMIGNDIPGLKILETSKAGVIVEESRIDSIKNAIKIIEENYALFSANSRLLFEKCDNKTTIKNVINKIYV